MNRYIIRVIFTLFWFATIGNIGAQENTKNASSAALNSFLNMPEVIKSFSHQKPKDSTLIIIDRSKDFQPNAITSWNGQLVEVIYDSNISEKLKKVYPFALFHEQCRYYVVMEFQREQNNYMFSLLQPCSGLVTNATIRKMKGIFRLVKIDRGVL